MRRILLSFLLALVAVLVLAGSSAKAPNVVSACGNQGPDCSCTGPGVSCGIRYQDGCVPWGCRTELITD